MKRSLSFLLCLILLCGLVVPAVHAAGPNSYRVEIECPNWHTEMDPAKLTYRVKTPGFTLAQQPVFIGTNYDGSMYDETGLRQQNKDYYLAVGLNTSMPFGDGDEITVVVNGFESDSFTLNGSHLSDNMGASQVVCYVSVNPYLELDKLKITAVYLTPGNKLGDIYIIPSTGDVEVRSDFKVRIGETLDAPVMQMDDQFVSGQVYLFECNLFPEGMNHRVFTENTVVTGADPLEFLPDRTVLGGSDRPDAVRLYFLYRPGGTYQIQVLTDGQCEARVALAATDETVTEAQAGAQLYAVVNVFPKRAFDRWEAEGFFLPKDQERTDTIHFEMPNGNITLKAITREADIPFEDVHPDDWFFRPVAWAYHAGVTRGVSPTKFAPKALCSRAEAITMLQNSDLLNPDVSDVENPFTDVSPDDWFYDSIMWAFINDIATGKTSTTFSPKALITRAEFCTMLWGRWDKPNDPCDLPFTDVSPDAYYYGAVQWCYEQGIISGVDATHFSPNGYLTRAEACTMLYADYIR